MQLRSQEADLLPQCQTGGEKFAGVEACLQDTARLVRCQ